MCGTHLSERSDRRRRRGVRLRVLVEPLPITMAGEYDHTKDLAVVGSHLVYYECSREDLAMTDK